MQENSAPTRTFFQRSNRLAAEIGAQVEDLPRILSIGRRTLFECRSADSAVSGKSWAKLEAAEAAAGIFLDSNGTAKSSGQVKGPAAAAGGENAGLFKAMFHKLAESGDLDWLQRRILELSQQAAAGDITAGHTVAALAPIVHARLHPEEQPAAPDL